MIQVEDTKTLPLPLPGGKRGRGRPRKAGGALTNAERQAAFRARRKGQGATVTVTKNVPVEADAYDALVLANDRLRDELVTARRLFERALGEIDDLKRGRGLDSVGKRGVLTVTDVLRKSVPAEGRLGRWRLTSMVDESVRCGLQRFAAHAGIALNEALERLVYWADDAVCRSFVSDEDFNRYLHRGRNEKAAA